MMANLNEIKDYQKMFTDENANTNLNQLKNLIGTVARKITSNPLIIEEAIQESIYKVTKSLNQYDPNQNTFSSWVGKIAQNTTIDLLRRDKYQDAVSIDEREDGAEPLQLPASENVEIEAIKNYNAEQVNKAIAQMKPNYAEVVKMFYYDGLLQEDIAKQLGIPLNTVKTRLSRAKQKIEEILGKDFL